MDGTTPFRFASFNIPNLHFIEDAPQGYFGSFNKRGPPDDFEITDALRTIAQIGGRVTRIYAFAYYDLYANRELFRAFDLMLTRANEFQIRIIIPFIDKWPFWGGVPEFSKWIGNKTADAFWTDTAVKNNFKSIIRYILERNNSISGVLYRDDPAILMWELGNELALKEGGRIPTEWTIEMAEYVKSVDSNHLVKDGSNTGAFGHQLEVLQHPSIDVIGSHYYHIPRPQDPTYIPPYPLDDSFASRSWVDSAFVTSFDKVFIVDEYGLESLDWTRELLKASVKNSKITGTLLWSLRFHSREGGFYTHDETPTQRAYHYPGFPFNETFNTRDEVEVIQTVKLYALLMHDVSVLEALVDYPFHH
ncbi:glycoside hydrolase superfamily [Obelidium mucronatum]|nr:glycoside hydrolase superfamily [Obelidium mucronatum]